jgi:hypothetical protein
LIFKDVTSEFPSIVATCSNNGNGLEAVKVFENDGTRIIYSFNERGKHLSLSNPYRDVTDSEIIYSIEKIMKLNPETITGYISSNGVYHFKYKTLIQDEQYPVSDILQ